MIRFQCPSCAAVFNTTNDKAGKTAQCPDCQATFIIPEPEVDVTNASALSESGSGSDAESGTLESVSCLSCGAQVEIEPGAEDQEAECPYCTERFVPSFIVSKPSKRRRPVRSQQRANDDDFEEDDDYEYDRKRLRRRRGPRKPGNVAAVGIMLLAGGIYSLIYAGIVTLSSFFVCCLWPGVYLALVWAIFAIARGMAIVGDNDDKPAPRTLFILQILLLLNLDVINCILGIVGLVLLNDEETSAYFDDRRPDD